MWRHDTIYLFRFVFVLFSFYLFVYVLYLTILFYLRSLVYISRTTVALAKFFCQALVDYSF